MAKLITFEGIEGSGKSTQIRRVADYLEAQGLRVRVTREPGGCPIADGIRQILLNPENTSLVPTAELLLYAAARAQHVEEVIRPALQAGDTVLCDRFTDATLAYQGNGRGLDRTLIAHLNEIATAGLSPDLTLLFDLPVATGLGRARARNSADANAEGRFEAESLAFHQRIRDGYLSLAESADRFVIIDADAEIDTVTDRLLRCIDHFLEKS